MMKKYREKTVKKVVYLLFIDNYLLSLHSEKIKY